MIGVNSTTINGRIITTGYNFFIFPDGIYLTEVSSTRVETLRRNEDGTLPNFAPRGSSSGLSRQSRSMKTTQQSYKLVDFFLFISFKRSQL